MLGVVAFVAAVGDPVDWIDERIDEFRTAGTPDLSEQRRAASRFNAGSGRYDLWRVALDDVADDPLLGDGGGGYQYTYLRKRDTATTNARDAHSVELELLAELGLPGLALFAAAIGGAAARHRPRPPPRPLRGRARRRRARPAAPTG